MAHPDLIFCFNASPVLTQIAINYGFLYGHRSTQAPLPNLAPAFLDLDHRNPARHFQRHLQLAAQFQPLYAVAGDATTPEELEAALVRARLITRVAPSTQIIIVPKTSPLVKQTPVEYPFITGYSVPTEFGHTDATLDDYSADPRRQIHILGGPPRTQLKDALYIDPTLKRIKSVDTNAHVKAAQVGTYWDSIDSKWKRLPKNTSKVSQDHLIPAFVRSSRSIMQAWKVWAGRS